jgi:hypothetical protein
VWCSACGVSLQRMSSRGVWHVRLTRLSRLTKRADADDVTCRDVDAEAYGSEIRVQTRESSLSLPCGPL